MRRCGSGGCFREHVAPKSRKGGSAREQRIYAAFMLDARAVFRTVSGKVGAMIY